MDKIRNCMIGCFSLTAILFSGIGQSQPSYPTKPISVQVGLQAGTGSDIAVRGMLERVGAALGQPFVIENSPGASGFVAAQKVFRTAPDGYQLVALSSGTVAALPHIDTSLRFDPLKDLVPIAIIATIPSVLFVHPSVPAKTVQEFIDHARKNPGKLTYATGGTGSIQHLATESFKAITNTDILHVPYKGSGQATLDLVAGRVDSAFQGVVQVIQFAKNNQVRLLAWSGSQRNALFPDLPTLQESGVADFVYEPWTALFGPAGMPKEIVEKINAEVRKAANQPDLRERWASQGLAPKDLNVTQTEALVRSEYVRTGQIVRANNIKAN